MSPLLSTDLLAPPKLDVPASDSYRRLRILKLSKQLAELDAEALRLYIPLPAVAPFHASTKLFRVVDGSNRAGKTNAGAVEVCRMMLGCDPYNKNILADGNGLVIGLDGDHLALMWAKCIHPGAFSLIRDEHTKLWRSVRYDPDAPLQLDPYDAAYCEKWKDAPPLLPPRMIRDIAWEVRGKNIPRVVRLRNGWTSLWRSSKGDSPQGSHLNLVWIDEQIENEGFYTEACRGLVRLKEPEEHAPKFIWTATPQNLNQQLSDLRDKAEQGSETIDSFTLLITDNPYIPADAKQGFYDGLSDDEREVRWFGRPAIAQQRVYPGYCPQGVHGCPPFSIDISKWARYIALDPGRTHCGTVFFAVDPDEQHVWIYDAFDLRNSDAQTWAGEVYKRQFDMRFEAIVIDQQIGTQTRPGGTLRTVDLYYSALAQAGIKVVSEGPLAGFYRGSNEVASREEAVLSWLAIRGTGPYAGTPTLQVMQGISPLLDRQFRNAIYVRGKRHKGPAQDVLVCVEYMAAYNPRYRVPTPVATSDAAPALTVFEQFQETRRKKRRRERTLARLKG